MNETAPPARTEILSLRQIAWWWRGDTLLDRLREGEAQVWADLPVIQRGFVWHANKIERLWDSIAKGYPIGSLMLQPRQGNERTDNAVTTNKSDADKSTTSHESKHASERHYFLLDGQQRATSIALGFKDIWTNQTKSEDEPWRALWVDIGQRLSDDRRFLFRLTSNAHPWGYASNAAATSGPSKIPAGQMLKAHEAFKLCSLNPKETSMKPHKVPAHVAFPWDAKAPVPLAFILQILMSRPAMASVDQAEIAHIKNALLNKIESLPVLKMMDDPGLSKEATAKFESVKKILETDDNENGVFQQLIEGLGQALNSAELPAPVLNVHADVEKTDNNESDETQDMHDPAFNLFARINTAGTALTGEEINYSLLKAAWPNASRVIDGLLRDNQITYPARLVSLLSRLALTVESIKSGKPSVRDRLSIAQFRKAIAGKEPFTEPLDDQIKNLRKEELLTNLWKLVAAEENDWTLPPVMAVDITRHNEELVLVVLIWLYRLESDGFKSLNERELRRTLGFITAVHWFAHDSSACAKQLGKHLLDFNSNDIRHFFNHKRFGELLDSDENNPCSMAHVPNPNELKKLLASTDKEPRKPYIWHLYFEDSQKNSRIQEFMDAQRAETAPKLLDNLVTDKRLVMYAQRIFIRTSFSWFDPTKVDRIMDHNVPWDFDHIIPASWFDLRRKDHIEEKPNTAKLWKESNGNYRVWPAESNRSKHNIQIIEPNLVDYELGTFEAVCDASAISESSLFRDLGKEEHDQFFANKDENFQSFISAAIDRTVDIYREWYENLCIGDLVEGKPEIVSSS